VFQSTMPVREAMKKGVRKVSFARLSPLAKGRIVGMREAGGYREEGHRQTSKEKMASLLPWWLWTCFGAAQRPTRLGWSGKARSGRPSSGPESAARGSNFENLVARCR